MKRYSATELGKKVLRIDGTPDLIPNENGTEMIEYNVKTAFRRALNGVYPDENNPQTGTTLSFEEKMKRYNLSQKIFNTESKVDLSIDEQALLQKCIGKYFHKPETLGFLNIILEGAKDVDEPDKPTTPRRRN